MESKGPLVNAKSKASLSTIPNELLCQILEYTMASDEPLYLQEFYNVSKLLKMWDPNKPPRPIERSFFDNMDHLQKEHYNDWLIVNDTSRRIKDCGMPIFFSRKTIVITSATLHALLSKASRECPPHFRTAVAAHARDVVADLRSCRQPHWLSINLASLTIPDLIIQDNLSGLSICAIKESPAPRQLGRLLGAIRLEAEGGKFELILECSERIGRRMETYLIDDARLYLTAINESLTKLQRRLSESKTQYLHAFRSVISNEAPTAWSN